MIYKEKVQGLLETLHGRFRIIQGAASGGIQITPAELNQILNDTKQIIERIDELISIER
jgi:hypothetical protein